MNNKTVFAALLGLTMAGGIGVTAAQAAPVMTDPPYFFIVEDAQVVPVDQPKRQQDIVGHTNTVKPRPIAGKDSFRKIKRPANLFRSS